MTKFDWTIRQQRSKRKNIPTEVDGFRFDSKTEAAFYQELKLWQRAGEVAYIDVHPMVTNASIRWRPDFMVYFTSGEIRVYEVKGQRMAQGADRIKLFNQYHPLAPMVIVRRQGKKWVYEGEEGNS